MAIQSLTDLKARINSTIQDNTTNDISGSDVQTALINAIDTLDSLEGFINVHKANGQTTITAYESKALARAAVPDDCKKEGVVIAYKISTGWLIEQNLDATAGTWGDDASWQTIGPVSVSQNSQTGKTELKIGGTPKLIVDFEPGVGSHNLVESGGVDVQLNGIVFKSENGNNIPHYGYVAYNTGELTDGGYSTTDFIRVKQGDKIILTRYGSSSVAIISAYSSQDESDYMQSASIAGSSSDGATITYIVPNGVSFVRLSRSNTYAESFKAFIYRGYAINEKLQALTSKVLSASDFSNNGYLDYDTGNPSAHSTYKYTDRLPIGQGCFILLSAFASDAATALCFYKNGVYDKSISGYQDGNNWFIVVPEGVTEVAFCNQPSIVAEPNVKIGFAENIKDIFGIIESLESVVETNNRGIVILESELNNKQISEFNLNRWIKYSDGTIGGGGYGGIDIDVYEGQKIDIIGFTGSASVALIAFYDSNSNYMQSASVSGGSGTITKSVFVPNGAVLCKLSCSNPTTAKYVVSSNVVKREQADDIILSTPYIKSLISVDELNDNKGFINASGNVDTSSTSWRYAYKLPVLPKMKLFLSKISSNGTSVTALALYDKVGNLSGREYSSQNANQLNLEYVIPDGVYFISFSLSGVASSNFRYDKMTDGKPIEQVIKDTLPKKDIMPIVLPRIAKPIPISFQFDDNYVNTDRTIHNLFASYNKPCNWAFIASDSDVADVDLVTEYKNWQMKYGDGIMSHSINGTPFNTTNYTYETALAAISKAMENLEKAGFVVNGFVAPSSEMASEFMPILRLFQAYAFTSAAGDSTFNTQSSDLENLHRYSIQSHSLQEIKDYIDACITNGAMLVFYGHSADLGNTYSGTYQGSAWSEEFNIAKITSILEYALSKENAGLAYITNTDYAVRQFFDL